MFKHHHLAVDLFQSLKCIFSCHRILQGKKPDRSGFLHLIIVASQLFLACNRGFHRSYKSIGSNTILLLATSVADRDLVILSLPLA